MNEQQFNSIIGFLSGIGQSLKNISNNIAKITEQKSQKTDFTKADSFIWQSATYSIKQNQELLQKTHLLIPIENPKILPLELLCGVDDAVKKIMQNTKNFVTTGVANNTLLWGTRGMGKSSVVKAVFKHFCEKFEHKLKLIEIDPKDIETLPVLMRLLQEKSKHRFIIFCDDLSFDNVDDRYKNLKSALEGSISKQPDNCLFYATSNQRHLNSADAKIEEYNKLKQNEIVDENVSLSDRFGLWVGFHKCSEESFFQMVRTYQQYFEIPIKEEKLQEQARKWYTARGARSGRVAWQFIIHLLGEYNIKPKY